MGLLLILSQLLITLTAAAVELHSGRNLQLADLDRIDSFWGQLLMAGSGTAVAISVWIAGRFIDRRKFRSFGFSLSRSWWTDLAFGLGLGTLLMAVIFLVEWTVGWIEIQGIQLNLVNGQSLLTTVLIPLLLFIVIGFYEELFNRGYLIKNISESLTGSIFSPRYAVLTAFMINAVVFALLHLSNPNSSIRTALNISLAGLFLGSAYLFTGELAIPIGLHISWNFFQGVVFGFPVSGAAFSSLSLFKITQLGPDLWTGGQFGPEGGLLGTLVMLLGTGLIIVWIHSRTGEIGLNLSLSSYQPRSEPFSRTPSPNRPNGSSSPLLDFAEQPINHVIWDWNGTLLDDLDLCLDIINRILASRGLSSLTREQYQQVFDFPVKDYYQRLGFDFTREPFETISTEFITTYERRRSECHLMDGAQQALEAVSRLGISQSIISASKMEYLSLAVAEYGIEGYFERIMGLDNHHAHGKLALAEGFLASNNLEASNVLIIGDTTHDAAIAASLGASCLLIPNGHHSKQRLQETGAVMIDTLLDLHQQLLSITHGYNAF